MTISHEIDRRSRPAPRMAVSLEEYQQRVARTREWMATEGLDLLHPDPARALQLAVRLRATSVFYYQALIVTATRSR